MVSLPQLFESGLRGPPVSSDGPSPMCETYTCRNRLCGQNEQCGSTGRDVQDGQPCQCMGRGLQSRCGQQEVALIHGPQGPRAEMWPLWTSQTDVGQWPPEWCYTCLRGPLAMMESSDGHSGETFPKWSSRTAWSLTWTISNV